MTGEVERLIAEAEAALRGSSPSFVSWACTGVLSLVVALRESEARCETMAGDMATLLAERNEAVAEMRRLVGLLSEVSEARVYTTGAAAAAGVWYSVLDCVEDDLGGRLRAVVAQYEVDDG